MKILIIGGHGTIGRRVADYLSENHELVIAGRTKGDVTVDITDSQSIQAMLEQVGQLDAVVSIAGEAKWAAMDQLEEEDYYVGIRSKLMGQVNLARLAANHFSGKGSITLSTGILADQPVLQTTSAAMVNGAIHSFVKAAALEMTTGVRINAVSLGVVEDAYEKYKDYFPGHNPVPTSKVINAYVRSILGADTGQIIRNYE